MGRAILTLVVGVVAAVLLAALIAGSRDLSAVLGPILVTTAFGGLVFAAVARRTRTREAAQQLDEHGTHVPQNQNRFDQRSMTNDEEPDRG